MAENAPLARPYAVIGAVAMLLVGALWWTLSPAGARPEFALDRLADVNRFGTARAIALDTFQSNDIAILATGDQFPDALAGAYIAGLAEAPVLLTSTNSLPPETLDALKKLNTKGVALLGGTGAISTGVENELKRQGFETLRVAGVNRYDTARRMAVEAGPESVQSINGRRTAIVASGETFPDALAGGPLSFQGFPTLLTRPDALPEETKAALQELNIQHVFLLGGVNTVSPAVEAQLKTINGITVLRIAGANRSETSVFIAEVAIQLGFSTDHVDIARGDAFADALAGVTHAGVDPPNPIVLTESATVLGTPTRQWLESRSSTLKDGDIFGGLGAVAQAVEESAEQAGRGTGTTSTSGGSTSSTSSSTTSSSTTTTIAGGSTTSTTFCVVPGSSLCFRRP